MRLLVIGDIFGRSGRDAVIKTIPELRKKMSLDFVIANAENATQGRGITLSHAQDLLAADIDCLTLGDHSFDQRCLINHIESENRIIRPINFARAAPGNGYRLFSDSRGRKILVISALGRVFMKPSFDDPFPMVQKILDTYPLGSAVNAIILDFHAEATSEKNAMGLYFDGRLSLVAGSHTHIPTSDHRIMNKGTGYISDLGMCGDYNSVIGVKKNEPISRFVTGMNKGKFIASTEEATICGVIIDTDDTTGLVNKISSLRIGGILSQSSTEILPTP